MTSAASHKGHLVRRSAAWTLVILLLVGIACQEAVSEETELSGDLGISDSQIRATLTGGWYDSAVWITTEEGTGVHEGTTFVLATWFDDRIFAQWNLRDSKVRKLVVLVDPDDAYEPYLEHRQTDYVRDLAYLAVPRTDHFDVLYWLLTAWSVLEQQDRETTHSATIHYRGVKVFASVYLGTAPFYVVEFTKREG